MWGGGVCEAINENWLAACMIKDQLQPKSPPLRIYNPLCCGLGSFGFNSIQFKQQNMKATATKPTNGTPADSSRTAPDETKKNTQPPPVARLHHTRVCPSAGEA